MPASPLPSAKPLPPQPVSWLGRTLARLQMRSRGRYARSVAWNDCVNNGDVGKARWLLDHGLKPHPEADHYFLEQCLFTALRGPVEMIPLLVEAGADPNVQDGGQYRDCPLLRALRYDRFAHARALLALGAKPGVRDFSRFTSFMIALDTDAATPLTPAKRRAIKDQAWAMVRDLVAAGANPDTSRKGEIYLFGYATHPARLRWLENRLQVLCAPSFMLGNLLHHGLQDSSGRASVLRMMDHHLKTGGNFQDTPGPKSQDNLTLFQGWLKDLAESGYRNNGDFLDTQKYPGDLLAASLARGADPAARNPGGDHAFDILLDMADQSPANNEARFICNRFCEFLMDHTTWAHLDLPCRDGKTVLERLADIGPGERIQALLDQRHLQALLENPVPLSTKGQEPGADPRPGLPRSKRL